MEYSIFYITVTFFCILGMVWAAGTAWHRLLLGKAAESPVLILPVQFGQRDIEYRLRSAEWQLCWCRPRPGRLFLVNLSADEETVEICRMYIRRKPFATLCTCQELQQEIGEDICKTLQAVLY